MRDLQKLVGGLSKSGALSGFLGGVAGGGLTSMVTSKKGRKAGGKVLKYGALAAVGGLAWKAYKQYSANQQGQQAGQQHQGQPQQGYQQPQQQPQTLAADTYTPDPRRIHGQTFDFAPATISQQSFEEVVDESNEGGQLILMRAMIAAAYADGHIDENERQNIFNQVESMELSIEEKAMLFDELRKPMSMHELVAAVPNAQTGIEVYAASASAIDLEQPVSGQYLQALANQLCLPRELVSSIHQQLQTA
ncbi:tellurite resistance TerB family protein [Alteromonas sp. ASW11-36]|uniref:Tellurite resistance TerB family protein n=1 Tax=Alteromonas arenosi TaxID=3055817 RepID=A0ABT7SWH1_9ALTE|nr:tellurite resistance TerB family protein [Alteromonas sp. ASW11-36]MDM7859907.1 tellurite resistance TerB family protein [Alteromonas sp. ASW11-36]